MTQHDDENPQAGSEADRPLTRKEQEELAKREREEEGSDAELDPEAKALADEKARQEEPHFDNSPEEEEGDESA